MPVTQQIKRLCQKHRTALWVLLVVLLAGLTLAWAGYDLGQRVDNAPVFAIVNDEYSQTVEIPAGQGNSTFAAGLVQTVPLSAGQPLYGVRLDMTTYNYAFAGGALHADLYTADGNLLYTGALPLLGLKDNTFTEVIFSDAYTAVQDETLQVHIWYETPGEEEHPLGLWASEGQVGGMALCQNGTPLNATAALQFVVNYSGRWSALLSGLLFVLLLGAVLCGVVLLFGRKAQLPAVVLACGLLLGGAFSVATPPLVGPDEYTHLANVYERASGLLGQPATELVDGNRFLRVRACDASYFQDKTGDIGIFAYKTYLAHLGDTGCEGALTTVSTTAANTGILNTSLYLGQIAGVALARLLGLGFHGMLLLGRLGNLLLYLLLAALAVRVAPAAARGVFACVALLPMALQLAGSLSADALVLGLVFVNTALCLALRQRSARPLDVAALLGLALYIGPAKAIYLPVVLLVLLVPTQNLDPRRAPAAEKLTLAGRPLCTPGAAVKSAVLLLALLAWVGLNLGAALYATRDVDNVGLTRAAVAVATAAVLLGGLYYKVRRHPKYRKWFFGVLAAALCVAVPVALYRLTHMWGGLTPEQLVGSVQANGDSIYTYSAGYICRNLPGTVKLLLRSVSAQGALWLQELLGTALGEPIVYPVMVSWLLGLGLALTLAAAALPTPQDPLPLGRRAKLGGWFIVLCVAGLAVFVALSWTPINYTTLFGMQGRYLLPVLPLALVLLGGQRRVAAQKPLARGAVLATVCLTSFVILQGVGIYAAWQMQ